MLLVHLEPRLGDPAVADLVDADDVDLTDAFGNCPPDGLVTDDHGADGQAMQERPAQVGLTEPLNVALSDAINPNRPKRFGGLKAQQRQP